MKYKVGDRVRIKSIDWYNENKDNNREIKFENGIFTTLKSTFLGQIMTIEEITLEKQYILMEDRYKTLWTDEMIEGLVEDENNRLTETVVDTVRESDDRYRIVIDPRFNIEVDEGEYYAVRRKKEYPKTYEECCKVMNYCCNPVATKTTHREELIRRFQFLLLYRDAYWKIAGEEMGWGKPWEPDWTNHELKYCIKVLGNTLKCVTEMNIQCTLAFPTPEMQDEFKKNFDPDIRFCKDLL